MKTSWSIELYFLLNLIHFLKKLFILLKYFYSLEITYSIYQTCSFSFLGSSQILSHPSYSPNFLFFLSLKAETKEKPRKTHGIELILNNYNYSWEWGLCGWYSQWHSIRENWLPLPAGINNFLVRGEALSSITSLCAGVFVWFEPV